MNKLIKNTYFQQLLFWSLSFTILYRLFTREGDNGMTDVYYTLLFHLPLVLVVYGNYFLVNRFIFKKRGTRLYLFWLLAIIGLGVGLHFLTFNYFADWIFPGYYFVTFYTFWEVLEFVGSYAVISGLLFLSKNWFQLKEKQLALEKENHQVKLASLKAQLNPHFLFNSLNNIYGITSAENKLGRSYLLKLSDALRYMIYDTSEELVPLEKEINYLKNYVALEKLRMEEDAVIEFNTIGDFSGYMIAPLILLPIVENCFKYYNTEKPMVKIDLSMDKELFTINTFNTKKNNFHKERGGVGLTNLKNRLELIYLKNHTLNIEESKNDYKVFLTINLS